MKTAPPLDLATLEAAANWYVDMRCETPDPQVCAAHQRWLELDPRHQQAWKRLQRLQDKLGQVTPGIGRPTLSSARAKRREVLKVLALLVMAGGAGTLGWRTTALPNLLADQRTGTGERRHVRLDDGSQLELNSATSLNIRYSAQLRELHLLAGEILVQTARDAQARPFIVHTAAGSIHALGTRFIVRSEGGTTSVSVQEHAVEVRPAGAVNQVLRVDSGQQLSFAESQLGTLRAADPHADAWVRGMLVVSDWPLADFVTELQRYHPGHLGYASDIAGLRISGIFNLGNTDTVLDNLTQTLPVRIRRFSRYWATVERV
ncbi:FecR domain-containing protein [Pseudomonas fontis]|uniref:FecR domain-containing protein n=1 Tax=Pseudomonas fontis TaxID=2942633 RepID=A0ABT5NUV9_9PSED|nr:FecR domain-containing protein [Pseudomonas fontis]MDD0977188.1 FecR domain-containing protein [Pseudomonas fontis]MDD0991963.1 FecR domain-containing protein [Pseudomonas fontis]